jgi:putative transposase
MWLGQAMSGSGTNEGWLFFAAVVDLLSRRVVGWSFRKNTARDIVIDVLRMASFRRHPDRSSKPIFHSDQRSQGVSDDLRGLLKKYDTNSSMSRRGNCWDNGFGETLFGSLKVEWLYGQRLEVRRQAKNEMLAWLTWYNSTRMHLALACGSPGEFGQNWLGDHPMQASS